MPFVQLERMIQAMKCLTIVVDDKEIYSGEVAEIQWTETAESVSVTGKFKPAPSLLQALQQASKNTPKRPNEQLSRVPATIGPDDLVFPDE